MLYCIYAGGGRSYDHMALYKCVYYYYYYYYNNTETYFVVGVTMARAYVDEKRNIY